MTTLTQLPLQWEPHIVQNENDRIESIQALSRVTHAELAEDFDVALLDVQRSNLQPSPLHFGFIVDSDATSEELRTIQSIITHCIGERWHRIVGKSRLLIRSEERSQALVKSFFTLLCQVLDEKAPPSMFGTLSRIPVTGVVWFGFDTTGGDPGVYAVWIPVRDEVPENYHTRCPAVINNQ